jgi:ADP-dependent phosphofructokinase/glucokinase
VIHVEFGHYSDLQHFQLFEKYAVRNADSLGMNEVEMQMLLDYWSGDLNDINEERTTIPHLTNILEQTDRLFKEAKAKEISLSRVHLHPYGSFLMCYD